MYDEIIEIAENRAYLNAVKQETGPNLDMLKDLKPYEELTELEEKLKTAGKITFDHIFHEPTGYYLMKCFLTSDYSVDKAVFVSDVELYRKLRDHSARRKVAKLIYDRFVGEDDPERFPSGESVFERNRSKKSKPPASHRGASSHSYAAEHKQRDPSNMNSHREDGPSRTNNSNRNSDREASSSNLSLHIGTTNRIGVYGKSVRSVKEILELGQAPDDLFHGVVQDVLDDLRMDVFPRFKKSQFYKRYIQVKHLETAQVTIADFQPMRPLGKGAFGIVNACIKKNSGKLYAMKCLNKKHIMAENQVHAVLEERKHLTRINNAFVVCLKYALQDDDTLYLILDLMQGGDLKYHLCKDEYFSEDRARFYAAEILLGLQHIHELGIMYRDIKLENMLLDERGHTKISDLGLSVEAERTHGYAGTPGYTAPEVCRGERYTKTADFFSYGVMIYRFLSGKKPFGQRSGDLDDNVKKLEPDYPSRFFSEDAISLLKGLLQKNPNNRLGHGPNGIDAIKNHRWFKTIDFGLLAAGYIDPPWVPASDEVNAESVRSLHPHSDKYRKVRLTEHFKKQLADFSFQSKVAIQHEIVEVMEKMDENTDFRKFAPKPQTQPDHFDPAEKDPKGCCTFL